MSDYIFTEASHHEEWQRLQAIEKVFDPVSHRRIGATGWGSDWQVLEVGAGAGSLSRWFAHWVGAAGRVVAVDRDTRFLQGIPASLEEGNLSVVEGDIIHLELPQEHFDLVHARCLLIHIPNYPQALQKMLHFLKPGGWLVLEEPDFAVARAIVGEGSPSVERVNRAILKMFAQRQMDPALGSRLPALLQAWGLEKLRVESDALLAAGGSEIAQIMQMSARHLATTYLATGEVEPQDIAAYQHFALDPTCWAIYYANVGTIAQKPV
ncbi:MAG: methyltransferase domain-containing protein [Cyanobacteriota bacterium]|nr:methyltransferase domain-containing protein [Cyanobacteriota bacterium]